MPDYAFEGKGLRIDGITDGKPAAKAGLKQGDVILKLGEYNVEDIQQYMKALNHYSKGESSSISVLRGSETLTLNVVF
jgi:S1-C subfamily serine protease